MRRLARLSGDRPTAPRSGATTAVAGAAADRPGWTATAEPTSSTSPTASPVSRDPPPPPPTPPPLVLGGPPPPPRVIFAGRGGRIHPGAPGGGKRGGGPRGGWGGGENTHPL